MANIIYMAKHYNKRPSELLDIDNSYVAFCLDEAAYLLYYHSLDGTGYSDFSKIYPEVKKEEENGGRALAELLEGGAIEWQ